MYIFCKNVLAEKVGIDTSNDNGGYRQRYNYYGYNSYYQQDVVSKKDENFTFNNFIWDISKKCEKLGIDNHKRILDENWDVARLIKTSNWKKSKDK